jgi:nucleoside-diphosphate-sugar epimerase
MTVFRYFTVYGPAGRPDMVMFRFIQWIIEGKPLIIFGDGEQWRGFTYVDDIARGTILGLKRVGFEVLNLGGHETLKLNKLVQILEELTGEQAILRYEPPHPADMQANWANIEKARDILNWEPDFNLIDGIAHTVDWYQSERSWAKYIKTI